MVFTRLFLVLSIILASFVPIDLAAAEPDQDQIEDLGSSLVFLRVQRSFMGNPVITGGTAVCIHPDGYLVTDLHAVGTTLFAPGWFDGSEVNAPLESLVVEIPANTGGRHRAAADVISVDRRASLALLKMNAKCSQSTDLVKPARVFGDGAVQFLGYSYSGGRRQGGISVPSGPRLSIVREAAGSGISERKQIGLRKLTEVELDEGHCGGLALDSQGKPTGLAICEPGTENRIGSFVSLPLVSAFLVHALMTTEVDPAVVLNPPQPISVEIVSRADHEFLASLSGKIDLLFGESILATIPLQQDAEGWSGVIDIKNVDLPRDEIKRFEAKVALVDTEQELRFSSATKLDVVPGALDELQGPRPIVIEETPEVVVEEKPEPTRISLSDIARKTSLNARDGQAVIDSSSIGHVEVVIVEPEPVDERRYGALSEYQHRQVARAFDEGLARIKAFESTLVKLEAQRDQLSSKMYSETKRSVNDRLESQRETLRNIRTELVKFQLCLCLESTWHFCYDAPCTEPRIPDPFSNSGL